MMMNMPCPEDLHLSLGNHAALGIQNQAALHNLQALQSGNFLLQGYPGASAFSGQLILPGYTGNHINNSQSLLNNSQTLINTSSALLSNPPLMDPVTSQSHQLGNQLSYSSPGLLDKSAALAAAQQTKKFRPPVKPAGKANKYIPKPIPSELGNLKTYSNPDILICGNCRELFSDLVDMLTHKKHYCKMRFTCKCESGDHSTDTQCQKSISTSGCDVGKGEGKRVYLKCTHCTDVFSGAWDLMFHVQNAHSLNIYTLGDTSKKGSGEVR